MYNILCQLSLAWSWYKFDWLWFNQTALSDCDSVTAKSVVIDHHDKVQYKDTLQKGHSVCSFISLPFEDEGHIFQNGGCILLLFSIVGTYSTVHLKVFDIIWLDNLSATVIVLMASEYDVAVWTTMENGNEVYCSQNYQLF